MHTNNLNDGASSSSIMDRKRKRRNSGYLRVRFCTEPSEIIDTYSPFEYNRSGLFPDVDHNEENEQPITSHNNNNNIILTLSFGFMTPTTTNSTNTSSSPLSCHSQQSSTTPLVQKRKGDKKKPKLSIDTSNIQNGPLYFTSMTTNHQKNETPTTTTFGDDDSDAARITMENTEINRRCLVAAV